jgi:PGF-CTERM protein
MRKTLSILALGALLVSLASTATAQDDPEPSNPSFQDMQSQVQSVGDIEVSVGSKAIVISWQGITLGANLSSWLREKVDGLDGNEPDGTINAEEADNAKLLLENYIAQEFRSYAHDERLSGYLVIDHTNPEGATVDSLAADGITGPVVSDQGISLSFVTTIGFPTQSADVHTVKLDMGRYYFQAVDPEQAPAIADDFTLTVRGGNGWSIVPDSVQPSCASEKLADGAMVFTVDDVNCFTGRSGVLMSFSVSGGDDGSSIPGFGGALWVVGLLGAGLLFRRRN